ncbi:MAG TPA: FG-GAP-like repeat-containing protein [Verrucomicrobiae bacterium]
MKTKHSILAVGIFLATVGTGFGKAPVITIQPTNQTVCFGTDAIFTVGVTGTEPLSYQWQKGPDPWNFTNQPGCTDATMVLTNVQPADNLYYRVVITNVEGAVTSSLAYLFPGWAAMIPSYGQPTNWTLVSLGATVANRVAPDGTPPFTYQWRFSGAPLPGQTKSTIILTNLQMSDVGNYDVVVANACSSATSQVAVLTVDPTFTKITSGAIVTDQASFGYDVWGGCWGDYDGDGFPDLIVPAGVTKAAIWQRPHLYHNQEGTNFVRVPGIVETPMPYCNQGLWADFNNDGHLDLLEAGTTTDWWGPTNRLFLGRADHSFEWVTNDVTPGQVPGNCLLVDYDNDGAVDLFHLNGWTSPYDTRATLRRNRGDANFDDVWSPPGPIINNGVSAWADYDNDGDSDLWHLCSQAGQFYRNNGGNFEFLPNITPISHRGVLCGDYDNDGYLDLLHGKVLRHNDGGTNFPIVWTLPTPGNVRWGDFDNDGDLDIVCGGAPCCFYRHDGLAADGRTPVFTIVDLGSPSHDLPGGIPSWCDYNNDGFLDLFLATTGDPAAANLLYRNSGLASGNTNRWLIVKPKAVASNYSAIGVKVRVKATIRGKVTWQMREISGNHLDDLRAHFGLADATKVDLVRVEWTSGIVQELTDVTPGQILTVVEHQEGGTPAAFAGVATVTDGLQLSILEPGAGTVYAVQASTDLVNWAKLMARKSTGSTFAYTDTRSTNHPRHFYRVVVP